MTDAEAQVVFGQLTRILSAQGLGWIADSVRDDIQLRSLVEVKEADLSAEGFKSAADAVQPSYRKAIRKSTNFLVRRDYSAKEQLILLVDVQVDVR